MKDLNLASRATSEVMLCSGNVSSATAMFGLQRMMQEERRGCAVSLGLGLSAETMRFHEV